MKKVLLIGVLLCSYFISFAQTPQKFSYQAVAVDASGAELRDQDVCLRATILSGSFNGIEEWVEVHSGVTTDDFGLFTVEIGDGQPVNGAQTNFADIQWGNTVHFLKVEMALNAQCTDFVLVGTNQLLSVPYALYSENSGYALSAEEANYAVYSDSSNIAAYSDSSSVAFNAYFSENATYSDSASVANHATNANHAIHSDTAFIAVTAISALGDDDPDPQNEIQELTISASGDSLQLTNSNTALAIKEITLDRDTTNELQELELIGSILTISGTTNNFIDINSADADIDPTNEIQELEANGTVLSLSGSTGNGIDIQALDGDSDPQNEIQELTFDAANNVLGMTNAPSSIDLSVLSGFNASGADLDFPQGVGVKGVGFQFFPDEITVPTDSVLYVVASEEEMLLPDYGNEFGRHLTGPNLPILAPGTKVENCRCIGFFKPLDPFFQPIIKVLDPNQGNFYQVPVGKNFIIKSGLDQTTPVTLNGFTISPFGAIMKAFAVPDGIQIKNLGNDEVILTGYLIDK